MTAETHPVDKERLMAYLDGQLSPEAAVEIVDHLSACTDCQAVAAEFRSLSANLSAWTVDQAPAELSRKVMEATRVEFPVSDQSKSQKFASPIPFYRRTLLSKPFWAAAACVLIAVAFLWKTFAPEKSRQATNDLARYSLAAKFMTAQPAPNLQPPATSLPQNQAAVASDAAPVTSPAIARTASLKISVKDLGVARATLDQVVRARGGYVASININTPKDERLSLDAELHIPASLTDAALADLRALGHVEQEQQGGEEVTAQVFDLDARLKNARESEARLTEILRTRTGKLSDVVEVEQQISSTREDIERMEAEQKQLQTRITYASIQVNLHEEYAASLDSNPASFGRRIRNAFVDGTSTALDGLASFALAILYAGPTIILVFVILFWPARWAWRRLASARKS